MSLIAWYKLDGNALDSSGNNSGTATNVSWLAGKIGQAGDFNGTSYVLSAHSGTLDTKGSFSVSLWVNMTSIATGGSFTGGVLASKGAHATRGWHLGIDWNTLYFGVADSSGNSSIGVSSINTVLVVGEWHYVTAVYNYSSGFMSIYIDGILKSSGTRTIRNPSCTDNLLIGRGYSYLYGKIDDVRIYDHALSEKEIKELAKAKILHYTFDEFQEPTENIWSGGLGIYNNYGVPASLTSTGGEFKGATVYRLAMTVDDAHSSALSHFQTELSSHGVYGGSTTFLANTKYAASIFWKPVNKFDVVFGGTASNIHGFISTPTEQVGEGWNRYTQIRNGTVTENKTDNVFFSFYSPSLALNETIYIDVCAPQIEKNKDYPTPYTSSSRTGSVSDNSGYGNNAVLASATTPQWTEDSRIGKGAYKFDESFMTFPPISLSRNNGWTFSCWFKLGTTRNTLISNSDFERFDISSTGFVIWVWKYNGQNLQTNTVNPVASGTDWHLLTLVFDLSASRINIFADGVYKEYFLYSPSNTPEALVFDKVGATFTNVGGYIDDYRIYATALSADDIKELYNTRAQIDDRGNFFSHNINQDDGLPPRGLAGYPIGWWPLSGDTKDYSGFGNDGINNGAVSTTGVLGEADTAYQFTEPTDYISLPASTSLVKSISFWIKEDAITSWLPFTGQSNSHYLMATSGGTGAFYHSNSGTPIIFRDSQETLYPAGDTSWHHYVVTNFDISSWTEIKLSGYSAGDWPLEGKVFDVRFYNRILSSAEIEALYNMTDLLPAPEPLPAAMRLHDNGIADFIDISEIGPAKGLVAYYPLNGNAKDHANANDGTVNGAVISAGINGKACYSFDGVNGDYIRVSTPAMNPINHTITGWFLKRSHTKASYPIFLSYGLPYIACDGSTSPFRVSYTTTGQVSIAGGIVPQLDTWYHVCATFASDGVKMYVNGNLQASSTTPSTDTPSAFDLGRHFDSNAYQIDGKIQNVRVYNRALSPEEISILYDLEKGDTVKVKIDKDTVYLSGEIYEG